MRIIEDRVDLVYDQYTGEEVSYTKTDIFSDGSAMNDSKADGVIYRKIIPDGQPAFYAKRNYNQTVNVKWFGAKGDGVTDDTAAFYSATTAVRGGVINVPNGTYLISQPFPFRRGIRWIGEGCLETISGRSTVIKLANGANCNLVETLPQIGSSTGNAFYQGIEHISFDGNGINQTSNHLIGININKAYITFYLNHVKVSNVKGTALSFHDGADVKIDHVWLVQNTILDPTRYCLEINQDLEAPNLAGYLNFNHLYVENTANKFGGDPRNVVADRGNAILIKRTASANFHELHIEGHARMVDLDTSNVVNITKISTAHCGNSALTDDSVIRLLNENSAITVSAMRIYNTTGYLLRKATGFSHNEILDIPQINNSSTASYNVGFKVSGYSTIPYYLPKTVISNLLRITKIGAYSPQYLRFDTQEDGQVYTYIKNNSQNLTFGSKFNQGAGGSEFDLLRLSWTGVGKGQIIATAQFRLDTTTLNNEFSQYSIGVTDKGTYGNGPVYSRLNTNNSGLDFISTVIVSTGAPTLNALNFGQRYFDFTAKVYYKPVALGTGASDWVSESIYEILTNKSTSTTLASASNTTYPSTLAVKTYIDNEDAVYQKKISGTPLTANYTATLTDHTLLVDATSGNLTITLPTAASAYNTTSGGYVFTVKKIDTSANTVTIKGDGAETIDGVNTQVLSTQWMSYQVQSNGTNWFII